MKTGVSLCSISNRENPVFITGIPATENRVPAMRTGVARNENRFFLMRIYYTGKTLFWPCTDPVRDCSVPIKWEKSGKFWKPPIKFLYIKLLEGGGLGSLRVKIGHHKIGA